MPHSLLWGQAKENYQTIILFLLECWGYVATVGEGVNAEIIREDIKKQGRKNKQLKLF